MEHQILYTDHGEQKRRKEGLSTGEVRSALERGLVLRRYPDDRPHESRLILHWLEQRARLGIYDRGRPIHVVAADDNERGVTWVITIYEPDPAEWTDQFRWRRQWNSTTNTWRE